MKKFVLLFICAVLAVGYAQEIIENPMIPQNENYGRVLELKEEMRIDGEGEDYYHNGANELQIDNSGNIYIRDSWSSQQRAHLLKFTPGGKFIKDLYKQGEGPGEIQSAYYFALSEPEVYVYDYMKRKIIVMDETGEFINEFKLKSDQFSEFLGFFEGWLVFMRRDTPYERRTSRLYDVKDVVVFVSKDGKTKKDFHTFLSKQFYIASAQGGGSMSWDPFMVAMGDDKLFVCCSREYLIQVLDLNTGEITVRFNRKYTRVEHEQQKWERDFVSKYNVPKIKFDMDVKALFYDRGYLWAKTSTNDEEKGALFDLFDSKGNFLDSFYINIKGRILKIDGDFLYVAESDEEELPLVVKYRIMDSTFFH